MTSNTHANKQQAHQFHAPLEVADVSRMQSLLVLPCSSSSSSASAQAPYARSLSCSAAGQSHHANRLAPIEMMAPSIHMVLNSGTPVIPKHSSVGGASGQGSSSAGQAPASGMMPYFFEGKSLPPLWAIPVGYGVCALWFSTCTLMAPGYLHVCGHTLCPLWAAVVLCHAAAFLVVWGDTAWACLGLLVLAAFPSVVLAFNSWVTALYLLLLAAFAGGYFWRTLHGTTFIVVCVCWFALLSVFMLRCFVQEHVLVQMGLMGFLSLAIAVIASFCSMRKLTLRVSVSQGS